MARAAAISQPSSRRGASSGIDKILRERLAGGVWRPNDRLPTEKELAAELNVCPATVQRHLRELQNEGLIWGQRGKGRFVSGLRQRPRTGNLGVVLFDSRHMANPAMSSIVASVGEVAAEANRSLRIFIGNDLPTGGDSGTSTTVSDDGGFLGTPASLGVDGLIILTQRISPETIRQLAGTMPVVCAHLVAVPNVSCIVLDAAAGAFDATRHLLELGHERIALITKDDSDAFGRAMREGARLAMGTVQATHAENLLQAYAPAEYTKAEGHRLAKELLSQSPRPTSVICCDHEMAAGMLDAFEEAGLSVPEDLSLISWNDVLVNRSPVSITSVVFDRAGAGVRLCRRLLECIDEPDHRFAPEYLRPQLVVRQSTTPPRAV